jgi:hypothetical protein
LLGILFGSYAISATASGPAVGTIAPGFKVHNLVTGEDITLSSQHGKLVILTQAPHLFPRKAQIVVG